MDGQLISGKVFTGEGEGALFTGLEWVRRQFWEYLGIEPYPGTLNLVMETSQDRSSLEALRGTPGISVDPPDSRWCVARCYPVRVEGSLPAAIVFPEVPGYPTDRVEVIAALPLRDYFSLEDGDLVTLHVNRPLPVQAVIFDVDGTLVDSLEAYRVVAERVAAPFGIEISRADVCEAMNSNALFWDLVVPTGQPDRQEQIRSMQEEAGRRWPAILREHGQLIPGIRETLQTLSASGFRLAIVTGSRETALTPLRENGLEDYFDMMITRQDVERGKPDPQGLLLCAQELGLPPGACVYVGDAVPDIQAGRAAGMAAVGVLTGAGDSVRLSAESPDWIVASLTRLPEILVLEADLGKAS